jgi:TonB family protein
MRAAYLISLLAASSLCFADLKFRMRTMEEYGPIKDKIVYVQAQRVRTEFPDTGLITIRQCDLNRVLRLDPNSKTYSIAQIQESPDVPRPQTVSASGQQICQVKMRRQVEELSDGQQLFGLPAQHLRIWIYMDPVLDSCPSTARITSHLAAQRDGWYLQVPFPECPVRSEEDRLGMLSFDGPDQYVRNDGSMSPEFYPAKLEVNVPRGQGLQTRFTAEISDVSTDSLDSALFDVPPDYRPTPGRDCSKADLPVGQLGDGTPVYLLGCGVTPPKIVYQTQPEFSEHARKKKISGTVILSLFVGIDGSVRDVKIERSLERTLDQQAMAAAKLWKFEPATKDEQPIAVRLSVEMSFRLY